MKSYIVNGRHGVIKMKWFDDDIEKGAVTLRSSGCDKT